MGDYQLVHAEVQDLPHYVEPHSMDAVITDPPYGRSAVPLYGLLAEVSAQVLKPGGSLVVMCGQSYLVEIMALMAAHLTYHWTLAYLTPGGQAAQIWPRHINTFWKPLLWFTQGPYHGPWVGDVTKSAVNDNDKRFHKWGQSASGMAAIVRRLTQPGDLICDPFCGGGTTGKAALLLGRRFLGLDRDANVLARTAARLLQVSLADTVQDHLPIEEAQRVRTCLYCGHEFPAQRSTADYCTPAHKQAAYRARVVTLAAHRSVTPREWSEART